jgi:outer membrane lipoprotein-sorting protein
MNNMVNGTGIKTHLSALLFLLLLLHPVYSTAQTSEEKGLSIAVEAERRDTGYGDSMAEMVMILRNRHGEESQRSIRFRTLEVDNDGDKSLTIFDTPKDVAGTAFLNFTHKVGDDEQWLYLPALKRVKRISSSNKSGSFMGSEFAYEDIASQEIEKYTYKWLRDEIYDNMACFVVERYPVDRKNSGYSRQIVWLDKEDYRTLKVEYYDRKDAHLKTLTISGYQQYMDKYWRPAKMFMINHLTGKSTELQYANYQFNVGLSDEDFNRNSLQRVR